MNKPVAWIWSEDGCNLGVCLDQDKQIGKQEFQDYDIPLYTHPVKELMMVLDGNRVYPAFKELTDEEINDCIREEASKDPCGIGWNLAFNVAKAILRKAQEK